VKLVTSPTLQLLGRSTGNTLLGSDTGRSRDRCHGDAHLSRRLPCGHGNVHVQTTHVTCTVL